MRFPGPERARPFRLAPRADERGAGSAFPMRSVPTEAPAVDRPPLFKLGIVLLVVHELIAIGLFAVGGVVGAFAILFGSLRVVESASAPVVILVGAAIVFALTLGLALAISTIGVCVMAWRGARVWVQALIALALINCVVMAPNPLGILAAVLCVIGSLQVLESTLDDDSRGPAGAHPLDPDPERET